MAHKNKKWKNKTDTPTYNSWRSMRARVLFTNKCRQHDFYKMKGIKICPQWVDDYDQFYKDMGERPFGTTLDRIDGNKNYEPSNCRWASHRDQQNNKSSNVFIERKGVRKTIGEWVFELELSETERLKVYKRHSNYGAKTFEELFSEDRLLVHRIKQRINKCLVCQLEKSCKWRKDGELCNTCYGRAFRWQKLTGKDIKTFPEWETIKWKEYSEVLYKHILR